MNYNKFIIKIKEGGLNDIIKYYNFFKTLLFVNRFNGKGFKNLVGGVFTEISTILHDGGVLENRKNIGVLIGEK